MQNYDEEKRKLTDPHYQEFQLFTKEWGKLPTNKNLIEIQEKGRGKTKRKAISIKRAIKIGTYYLIFYVTYDKRNLDMRVRYCNPTLPWFELRVLSHIFTVAIADIKLALQEKTGDIQEILDIIVEHLDKRVQMLLQDTQEGEKMIEQFEVLSESVLGNPTGLIDKDPRRH